MITELLYKGLFIGNRDDSKKYHKLRSLNVTGIVVAGSRELEAYFENTLNFQYCKIDILDDGVSDLLHSDCILKALDFMEGIFKKGGRVFVHCHGGVSRSAAICVGFIMKQWKLSFTDALALVRQNYPAADPADNFVEQLRLFEAVNFDLKSDHRELRRYRTRMEARRRVGDTHAPSVDAEVAREVATNSCFWKVALERLYSTIDSGLTSEEVTEKVELLMSKAKYRSQPAMLYVNVCKKYNVTSISDPLVVAAVEAMKVPAAPVVVKRPTHRFSCRKCRGNLFTDLDVVHRHFEFKSTCIFTEAVIGTEGVQGKITCPNKTCRAKLGQFNWAGFKCNECSHWQSPAFLFHASKIDILKYESVNGEN